MSAESLQLRWGVEQRLEFIEFRLFWEGAINRADLTEQFGVSVPQASNDLRRYQEIAPRNIEYDKSSKRYVSGPAFKPVLSNPNAADYLSQLRSADGTHMPAGDSWLSITPPVALMPFLHRTVAADVLRAVLRAVNDGTAMEVDYQSMGKAHPTPTRRWITPHAFANDGMRWHVRAFCHIDRRFKDFLLARILRVHGTGPAGAVPADDHYWHERLIVVLVPNPALPELQQRMIAIDYKMKKKRLEIPVRKALIFYFKNLVRLENSDGDERPHEAPLVVKNRNEFDAVLSEASA